MIMNCLGRGRGDRRIVIQRSASFIIGTGKVNKATAKDSAARESYDASWKCSPYDVSNLDRARTPECARGRWRTTATSPPRYRRYSISSARNANTTSRYDVLPAASKRLSRPMLSACRPPHRRNGWRRSIIGAPITEFVARNEYAVALRYIKLMQGERGPQGRRDEKGPRGEPHRSVATVRAGMLA
jgi:hypothetical protein